MHSNSNDDYNESNYSDEDDFYSDEDLDAPFSEDEPMEDDSTDEELEESFDNVVICEGIPITEKVNLIEKKLKAIFEKIGYVSSIHAPVGEDKKTKGYVFVTFSDSIDADTAVRTLQGHKFSKYIFKMYSYKDYASLINLEEVWDKEKALIELGYTKLAEEKELERNTDVLFYLRDPRNDQFLIRHDKTTEIRWNDVDIGSTLSYSKNDWTDTYITWSPKGTYIATIHKQGIALWGGPNWKRMKRFPHAGASMIDFSPDEKYIVTFDEKLTKDNSKNPKAVQVWSVETGEMLRGFLSPDLNSEVVAKNPAMKFWPFFKWSHDGKYFARLGVDMVQIYETPSMGLLDRKSLRIKGVRDFSWSPSDNYIAYWTSESVDGVIPASVKIVSIPSRQIVVSNSLFLVAHCLLHWQESGDYFAVKVDKYTKNRKSIFTSFLLFRMRSNNIPVELLETKEQVIAFAWEPVGHKFAIIKPSKGSRDLLIYTMDGRKASGEKIVSLLSTFEGKQANRLYWSPKGGVLLIGGVRPLAGMLEVIDVVNSKSLSSFEHPLFTDVAWDPTGRFVTSFISSYVNNLDNSYRTYTCDGRQIAEKNLDKLYQFVWRPRPPTSLTKEEQDDIISNLKSKFYKKYEKMDSERKKQLDSSYLTQRSSVLDEFIAWKMEKQAQREERAEERAKLLGPEKKSQFVDKEIIVEEIVEEFTEIIEDETTEIVG